MKYSSGNFMNTTNNRVESLNAKLKSVISRHSSLEEFVDNFFLVLRVLKSERDHKASLIVHKVPVIFHTTSDPAFTEYVKYLTPYAYKFVAKQMELKGKVKLPEMEASISCQDFNLNTSEGLIKVTPSTCQCGCWKSMKLPCRHILATAWIWICLIKLYVIQDGHQSITSRINEYLYRVRRILFHKSL